MATIQLIDLSKSFPGAAAPALAGLNLTIDNGETVAVVGPSGSGKSTLLRIIAGLEGDYQGQVLYDGREMSDVPPKQRHIGMVFQNYALYPHFRGHGNLSFFFRLRGAPDEETEARIRITSQIMGIGFSELLQRKPGTLSGGQQQRVAIGRAIVRNPQLFLLDEPLSNLDAKLRMQTRVEIKRLLQRFQITTVYVTHDQSEAIALGDRIAVLQAGRVEQVGPIHQLLHEPVNRFVAGFVGAPPMNLLTGGMVADGVVRFAEFTLPLLPRHRSLVYAGQQLTLGFRPEAAQWQRKTGASDPGVALPGVVEMVEPDLGRRTQWVQVRLGTQAHVVAAPLDQAIGRGEPVSVWLPLEHAHWFDEATGSRMDGPSTSSGGHEREDRRS
jgi:ABC-type sugar transport system ATPase subunit